MIRSMCLAFMILVAGLSGCVDEKHPEAEKPAVSDREIGEWAVKAVRATYALDSRTWMDELPKARPFYSKAAWKELSEQMEPFLELMEQQGLSLSMKPAAKPEILHEGSYKGIWAWKIGFPYDLENHTPDGGNFTLKLGIRMLVGWEKGEPQVLFFSVHPRRD